MLSSYRYLCVIAGFILSFAGFAQSVNLPLPAKTTPSNSSAVGPLREQSQEKLQSSSEAESKREWDLLSEAVTRAQRENDGKVLSVRRMETPTGLSFRIKLLTRTGRVRVVQITADSDSESSGSKN